MPTVRFLIGNARWLGGGFLLCLFSSFGQTFFISLSNGNIREEYALSNGSFGLIYMLATLCSAATLPSLGWLLDRHSAWRIAFGTMLGLTFACVMMAWSTTLPFLALTIYLLRLSGQGMMTEIAMTATGRWFTAGRGRAMAITTLGFHVGTGVLPLVFVYAAGMVGWREAWVGSSVVVVLVGLPAILSLIRVERQPRSDPGAKLVTDGRDWTMGEVVRSPTFHLIALAVLAPPFIGTTLFFHQIYLSELRRWPIDLFATGYVVMSIVTVVCSLICGWLIDRFSAVRLLPFFLLPMAVSCLVAANVSTEASIFIFMGFLGISNGFSSTLLGALWPELYGAKHLGSIRSVVVALMVLSSAIGPGITGLLIDANVSYPLQINAMAIYCVLMIISMTFVVRAVPKRHAVAEDVIIPGAGRSIDRLDPDPRRP